MTASPTRGFLLGKFMPPHAGHMHLCEFARNYVDELTILVCSRSCEPIPGRLRFDWMRELFPSCRVVWTNEDLPQEPPDHSDFWAIWRDVAQWAHPEPIDSVFASEDYGHRLAEVVGARFVPVDLMRAAVPVSATAIRADPIANWRFIPAPVRPYYVRSVCLFGPESTGKSTMAERLARRFETVHVPEYGRTYTNAFGTDVDEEDMRRIVLGHDAATQALMRHANQVLLLDTDPIMTAVWSRMLIDRVPAWLAADRPLADLYLLMDFDAPWVDDGTRYFPDAVKRRRFFDLSMNELSGRGAGFEVLSGSWDEKEARAVALVTEVLQRKGALLNASQVALAPTRRLLSPVPGAAESA